MIKTMEKKIDLLALRAHIEGCIWGQLSKFKDGVTFISEIHSPRGYTFMVSINHRPVDLDSIYDWHTIEDANAVIERKNESLKKAAITHLKEGQVLALIPPFKQESEASDGKKRMSVSMNGIRKNLYQNMYYLTKNLNRSNDNGTIHVEAEDIQSSMDGLRSGIGTLLCVYMDDREDFTDQSDLLEDFPWFNEESEAGND
jgi:hypothetical protein